MSAWAIFSMMGFYPDIPGNPSYTLTLPTFDKVTLHLDPRYYPQETLEIEVDGPVEGDDASIGAVKVGGKPHKGFRVSHNDLLRGLTFTPRR